MSLVEVATQDECLILILRQLSLQDIYHLIQVNSLFSEISSRSSFWNTFYLQTYYEPISDGTFSKYVRRSRAQLYMIGQDPIYCSNVDSFTFRQISFNSEIIQMKSSDQHLLLLDSQKQVWIHGQNIYNRLREIQLQGPQKLDLPEIQKIHASPFLNLFLDAHGHIWSFGLNDRLPQPLIFPKPLQDICEYQSDILGLDVDGQVWIYSQGNFEKFMVQVIQICSANQYWLALTKEGEVYRCTYQFDISGGVLQTIREKIPKLSGIVQLASGDFHSLALDEQGQVWSWGKGEEGQLGRSQWDLDPRPKVIRSFPSRIQKIWAGENNSLFFDRQGKLWGCGNNTYHQLGVEDQINRFQSCQIKNFSDIYLVSAGKSTFVLGNLQRT